MADARLGKENTLDFNGLRIEASQLSLGQGVKTASATAGAATLNQPSGSITSESLSTAAAGTYTLVLTNTTANVGDIVQSTVNGGTNTGGQPVVASAVATANTITFKVYNLGAAAFNGTVVVGYNLIKA